MRTISLVVLAAAAGLLVAGRLDLPLLEPEEGLYAVVARDTLADGQFAVPVLHGEPYLDKPPLLYWLMMGSDTLFGVHTWSARLVPAVAAWLTVLVVFEWGRRCGGWAVAAAAAAVLTLTGDFVYRGPMVTPNGLLGLFTTVGLAAGHLALRSGRVRIGWWAVSAVASGLGVLTKGPVAVVLVAGPLFVFPWVARGFARPGVWAWLIYLVGVIAVAGPWFVEVSMQRPEFVAYFFWKHNVKRFADPFDHAKPAHFYVPQMLLGGLPWTLLPVAAVWQAWGKRGTSWLTPDGLFALLAVTLGFVFFSLSGSKRSVYLVPLWPVVAFAVGSILAPVFDGTGGRRVRMSWRGWAWAGGGVAVVLLAGRVFWLPDYHRQFSLTDATREVVGRPPGVPACCYPHASNALDFDLGPESIPAFNEDQHPELIAWLRSAGTAVVVVKAASRDDLTRSLPADLTVTADRPCGLVSVLTVRRAGVIGGRPAP